MARTDIHSNMHLDPADYQYVGIIPPFDATWGSYMSEEYINYRKEMIALVREQGSSVHLPFGQCAHCGAHLLWNVVLMHIPTNTYICIGETCADGRFSMDRVRFDAFKKEVAEARERSRKFGKFGAWTLDNPGIVEFFASDEWKQNWVSKSSLGFLSSLGSQVSRKDTLSERQVMFFWKSVNEGREKNAAYNTRKAEQELLPRRPVPREGRYKVEGKVLKLRADVGFDGGPCLKMLVESTEHLFRVWGTVPMSIRSEVCEGDTVVFTATLKPSNDDQYFGFFSRPTKAEVAS